MVPHRHGHQHAYIMYRQYMAGQEEKDVAAESSKAFRRALMKALVGTSTARKTRGKRSTQPRFASGEVPHIHKLRSVDQVCTVSVCVQDYAATARAVQDECEGRLRDVWCCCALRLLEGTPASLGDNG